MVLRASRGARLVAPDAVNGIDWPIGAAEHQLLKDLPKHLTTNLRSIEELEAELANEMGERAV